jgi:hypothetical protein
MVAIVLAALAGGLAAFALRPAAGTSTATMAARNPAVEVRTQAIRRTIHVIRHEPGAELRRARGAGSLVIAAHARARTKASGRHRGAHSAGTASAAVATRASGSHGTTGGQSTASAAPVATRSSGSHGTTSAPASRSHPVTTRSSGSHGSPSSGRPVTRSSGGGHGEHGDGGDGNGGDD